MNQEKLVRQWLHDLAWQCNVWEQRQRTSGFRMAACRLRMGRYDDGHTARTDRNPMRETTILCEKQRTQATNWFAPMRIDLIQLFCANAQGALAAATKTIT
jgi:hypothetical protein